MAKTSVGIYISSRYVDIAELNGSLTAGRLLNFIRQEIPTPAPQEPKGDEEKEGDAVQDPVVSAIKAGLAKLKTRPDGLYTVLTSSDVMIRYFSMPALPKSEQAQAVRFEARKYIPFKLDEIASDFKILPPPKQRRTTEVFLIAATKERLNAHLEVFRNAGSRAVGVDIVLFALVRALLLEKKIQTKESTAVLYIDNDKDSASIHVIDRGMPFLSRDFKISRDDKEALFEKIASELRVSLGYYHRQNPQAEVSKIIVCGEGLFSGLDAFIADELKVITETLERLSGVKGAEQVPASSIIAIGTALGGLGRSPYSINLSPIAAMIKKKKAANILLAGSIAALIIILATFLSSNYNLKKVLGEFNAVKEKGVDLPAEGYNLDAAGLNSLKEQRFEEIKFLWLVLNNRISWTEKLGRIAKDIPDGVWIKDFTAQEKLVKRGSSRYPYGVERSLNISGNAFSLDSTKEIDYITEFFTSLKEDPVFMRYFDDIGLGSMDKNEADNYWITSFKIYANSSTEGLSAKEARNWWQER